VGKKADYINDIGKYMQNLKDIDIEFSVFIKKMKT
jgi:hypothetical protein